MTTKDRIDDKQVADVGYGEWKRAKVDCGLAQSRDRSAMIPVEQVLSDRALERSTRKRLG